MNSIFFTGSTECHVVSSETSSAFPLQAVTSFLCLFSTSVLVLFMFGANGRLRDLFPAVLGLWSAVSRMIYRTLHLDGTHYSTLMEWVMELDYASEGTHRSHVGRSLHFLTGGAAIRNLTLQTHFLFTLMDCRIVISSTHFFSLWKAKFDFTTLTVILCVYYISYWRCLILYDFIFVYKHNSTSLFLGVFLFDSSVFHVCW